MSLPIALKEWAVAVDALMNGSQILLMRKGGIEEETRDFVLKSDRFFLFPTYEHQKAHLLKPEFRDDLVEAPERQGMVKISCFAVAVADIEVFSDDQLQRIYDYHIWTDRFASERLKWKRTKPLHVLLLRTYRLEQAIEIPVLPEYGGCKSWIELRVDADLFKLDQANPVLSEEELNEKVKQIKYLLNTDV